MNVNWYPGHMKKTKETISSDLPLVDIVYEMADARIPIASRNPDIDELLKNKPRILLLNKSDLGDPEWNRVWVEDFRRRDIHAVLLDSMRRQGFSELFAITDLLMADKRNKDKKRGIQNTRTRVMVVGIPNVGKSSLINQIAKRKSAKTGNLPGVTKSKQWIKSENHIELLDTPGVLWPKLGDKQTGIHLAFTGAITDRILDSETLGYELLKRGLEMQVPGMIERYGEPESDDPLEYLEKIGRGRGFLLRGGVVDMEKTGQMVLDEFRGGLWGRVTLEKPESGKSFR